MFKFRVQFQLAVVFKVVQKVENLVENNLNRHSKLKLKSNVPVFLHTVPLIEIQRDFLSSLHCFSCRFVTLLPI